VLKRHGLSHVKIVGGGRIVDGYVVTDAVKGNIVDKLREKKIRVVAFGDSPLDMEVLKKADQAYVVVGDKKSRSKSMPKHSTTLSAPVFAHTRYSLQQMPSPFSTLPNYPSSNSNSASLNLIFKRPFLHATDTPIQKLLTTPTHNAKISGPALCTAHEQLGYFLATSLLSQILGLETYDIPHVQGHSVNGHSMRDEATTLIVPLIRGGEPMAFGISRALPLASFAHAYHFSDIKPGNFTGKSTIILVDSVINTGKSIVEFLEPLRKEHPEVKVVVVAGVVQEDAVKGTELAKCLEGDKVWLVALRKSGNKFVGTGGMDMGGRLFNTTYLE
jgi:uracil phosphoribosyltransferase